MFIQTFIHKIYTPYIYQYDIDKLQVNVHF